MNTKLEKKEELKLVSVIDVGSTSIRMEIAQIDKDDKVRKLDSLSQSVAIGSDTFTRGKISLETTEQCVSVLRNFSTVMLEYGLDLKNDVRAVATSAVREARNRDEFLDRLYIASGINIQVIDGTEVSRLTFLGITPILESTPDLRNSRLICLDVGGGSTEILGVEKGKVSFAYTYRLGSYRLSEAMSAQSDSMDRQIEVMNFEINSGVRQCIKAVGDYKGKTSLLFMGPVANFATLICKKKWDGGSFVKLRLAELRKHSKKILSLSTEGIVRKYDLTHEQAQTLGPAFQVYVRTAEAFKLKEVCVSKVTLRDGLLAEAALGHAWTEDFLEQVLSSVGEIGKKYNFDEEHAEFVTKIALQLFDAMKEEHQLRTRYKVILHVAGLLHDIGSFVGNSSHHKHTKYLMENSEIFGLSRKNIKMAAMVARYHRRATPRSSHSDYAALPREERLAVSKLSAILRVADALDNSHSQSIGKIDIHFKPGELLIEPSRSGEFAAQKRALKAKREMFEQVYGRKVMLITHKRRGK